MKVTKGEIKKSEIELLIELSVEEFKPFLEKGAEAISKEVKIEGFRPGKVPFDVLKAKVGEMPILEEAANMAIRKTIDQAMKENLDGKEPVGQPQVEITKLAPGNSLEYKVKLALLPEITLPDLKSAKVKMKIAEVKEEEVNKMLDQLRDMRVKEAIVAREAKDGDKLLASIEMFLDNVPVEGGQSNGTAIILGKDYVVPGFDKQLIGMKKGDVKEFKLPYPDNHYMKNLAGKMVEFKVKVMDVYERIVPEIDDEFAAGFGLKHAQELKDNIRKSIKTERQQMEDKKTEIEMLDKLIAAAKFGDLPQGLVDNEAHNMVHELEHEVEHQGGKFSDYLDSMKKTHDQLLIDLVPDAIKRIKSALLIREVAISEKISVSEKEIDEEIEKLLRQYHGYEKVEERVKAPEYRGFLKNSLANRKVMDRLKEWNLEQ